ncbi:hypothetical protein LF817_16135 [Halobacillus sp. A1]|uniref:hypothetical protein n=1 Tax=Halobacillus sp. A1 TaxID=2880262 RepID=UPI0020A62D07|nr:hypothetical protein [Halobacillus sp. A1]MCP3032856.1 hypothetical protein [Halobacillus sp. A1]
MKSKDWMSVVKNIELLTLIIGGAYFMLVALTELNFSTTITPLLFMLMLLRGVQSYLDGKKIFGGIVCSVGVLFIILGVL